MSSRHYTCLQQAQSEIQDMSLTGISNDNILILSVSTNRPADIGGEDRGIDYPYILISPFGTEQIGGPENDSDDITYPVLIAIIDSANQNQSSNLDRNLQWRESIIDHFHWNKFDGIPGPHVTTVLPLTIINTEQFVHGNLWVSGLVINFTITATRRAA